MIMLKSGNMDTMAAACPENGVKSKLFNQTSRFPCFGPGCMNMPLIYHDYTKLDYLAGTMKGRFYGTWDLDKGVAAAENGVNDTSFYEVEWKKKVGEGSWVFHHLLRTSSRYPWLMLYFRSDATRGFSGGYHYDTRGMSKIVSYLFFLFNFLFIYTQLKNNLRPCLAISSPYSYNISNFRYQSPQTLK